MDEVHAVMLRALFDSDLGPHKAIQLIFKPYRSKDGPYCTGLSRP